MIPRSKAALVLTLAGGIFAASALAPTPAKALSPGEAIGIGVGSFALGTALGAASRPAYGYASPYYGYSAPTYYYPPAVSYYSPAPTYYSPTYTYYGSTYAPSHGYGWGD